MELCCPFPALPVLSDPATKRAALTFRLQLGSAVFCCYGNECPRGKGEGGTAGVTDRSSAARRDDVIVNPASGCDVTAGARLPALVMGLSAIGLS